MGKKEIAPADSSEAGTIKQGSVAEFFRKRTQLVGFDFGLNKHTQYTIEFLDNALDAIESFHWKESHRHPEYAYKMDMDHLLENFSYTNPILEEDVQKRLSQKPEQGVDDEGYNLDENGNLALEIPDDNLKDDIIVIEESEEKKKSESSALQGESIEDDEEAKKIRLMQKKADELDLEVQNIMVGLENFLYPMQPIIDREPLVVMQITEKEAHDVYAEISKEAKDIYEYTLDVFDNGTGMAPGDLEKFGRYLASSKSQRLKQTRGSQGFGSPSAFSDAQNTTGRPITVISKDINHIYATCSQFYTTSKNLKEYIVPPTEVTAGFEHGTFISLNYLNVKYRKGFMDAYIQATALTNPHVTLILLDPNGEEFIFPRRVNAFPREPSYALPHPSSVNIGDFQDLLRNSENLTISAFLQENFVRMSSSVAKSIVLQTEDELERELRMLNLDHGFLTWHAKADQVYFIRIEKRIYGKAKNPRDKIITYSLTSDDNRKKYLEAITPYNESFDMIHKKMEKLRNLQKQAVREEDKKAVKDYKKEIDIIEKEIDKKKDEAIKIKKNIVAIAKTFTLTPENEVKDNKIMDQQEEFVKELMISKARPNELTQKQTEILFLVFKAQKYMSPPSDPAIPIGEAVLETTMVKEYGLTLSHRTDLFSSYETSLQSLSSTEAELLSGRILTKFKHPPFLNTQFNRNYLYLVKNGFTEAMYEQLYQKFDALRVTEDDFVCAHTRPPTSGKGLAFVVEAVIAISSKISSPKQPQQVVLRYVNRTPKLRDSSDCAIWKGIQSVNWKNYKLDTFDNSIPRGNIRIMVNVSGPYVHLMFKSQSKNALAEDDVLLKEIKFCLEAIGRKIRNYQNRRTNRENRQKRSKLIEKYIPIFISSLVKIASSVDELKTVQGTELEQKIIDRLEGRIKKSQDEIDTEKAQEEQDKLERQKAEARRASAGDKHKAFPRKPRSEDDEDSDSDNWESEEDEIEEDDGENLPLKIVETDETESKSSMTESEDEFTDKTRETSIEKRDLIKEGSLSSDSAQPSHERQISSLSSEKKFEQRVKTTEPSPVTYRKITEYKDKSSARKEPTTQEPPGIQTASLSRPKIKPVIESSISSVQSSLPSSKLSETSGDSKLVKPISKLTIISTEAILEKFPKNEWISIKDLIRLLDIKEINDARLVQLKIQQLTREKRLLITIKAGKTYWKLNE